MVLDFLENKGLPLLDEHSFRYEGEVKREKNLKGGLLSKGKKPIVRGDSVGRVEEES